MKTLDLTVEKLLAKLKFTKSRPNSKFKVKGKKWWYMHRKTLSQRNIKALSLTVQKVLESLRLKVFQNISQTLRSRSKC